MDHSLMPILFVGHGSPLNAIEDNEFSRAWSQLGSSLPKPRAILCISAHWETRATLVTAMDKPRTIHDFVGFPRALFEMQYPAPGSLELVERIRKLVQGVEVLPDLSWGLDHGCWSVLCRMFPAADVPVVQMSLDRSQDAPYHYSLGRQLRGLRQEGILIVGSGNIVHNLQLMVWEDTAYDWAIEFDTKVQQWMIDYNHEPLIYYERHGRAGALAVNTAEHYLPLLYILGLSEEGEPVSFFAEKIWGGSISMRGVRIG